jgi:hypothetical protein
VRIDAYLTNKARTVWHGCVLVTEDAGRWVLDRVVADPVVLHVDARAGYGFHEARRELYWLMREAKKAP